MGTRKEKPCILIRCFSRNRHDMDLGEVEYDSAEYEQLEDLKEKANKYFCLPFPVAWIPYEEWKEAKELSEMAIIHRQNACIENGRYDLVTYC